MSNMENFQFKIIYDKPSGKWRLYDQTPGHDAIYYSFHVDEVYHAFQSMLNITMDAEDKMYEEAERALQVLFNMRYKTDEVSIRRMLDVVKNRKA